MQQIAIAITIGGAIKRVRGQATIIFLGKCSQCPRPTKWAYPLLMLFRKIHRPSPFIYLIFHGDFSHMTIPLKFNKY